jgi:translocation and assembly module TamA
VLGGTVLATATLEYQIPVARDWSVALFSDAGDAAQGWGSYNLHHSYGIGARWFSPVAPFSLDLAKDPHAGGIKLHMSLGLAF